MKKFIHLSAFVVFGLISVALGYIWGEVVMCFQAGMQIQEDWDDEAALHHHEKKTDANTPTERRIKTEDHYIV